ncbi:hypothetical protein [Mycobacterium noviomagense]|uniref:Uncharacterized protein n=1 Tax=Mycobacterium noviomagense TaxID=459858 RepID=A0A7I7PHP1_9MYCO|nr:hypothetical protein [Mycobacterium noviomagense]ORB16808.1 hypothetical protein BST37_05825 [Mycobacterium noviomagense]BBY08157.1 hypothetical protein MNVI_34750 [Mycobacterium noviomagense]
MAKHTSARCGLETRCLQGSWLLDREHWRRAALAARADDEHLVLTAGPVHRQTHSLPWQMVSLLGTEPIRTKRNST